MTTPTAVRVLRDRDLADPTTRASAVDSESARWAVWARGDAYADPASVRAAVGMMQESGAAIIFGDSTRPGEADARRPHLDPYRLRAQDYLGDILVLDLDRLAPVWRSCRAAALRVWRHELLLAALRGGSGIRHLGRALGGESSTPLEALGGDDLTDLSRAVETHLAETGGGEVRAVREDGIVVARRRVTGSPLVSIVIPTRARRDTDGSSLALRALESIVQKTSYTAWEIILVVDADADQNVIDAASVLVGDRMQVVTFGGPFNFSEKINLGAAHARGEYLLMLNDDVEVISSNWLEALIAPAQGDRAGLVGAMLYFDDDTIQHAGHHYWLGDASHIGLDVPRGSAGPDSGFLVERRVAGVTAACALTPMTVFREVGALDPGLPGAFNDVDYSLKVTWAGYDCVWTPDAELYHFESKSRDATVRPFEVERHWERWAFRMHQPEVWPYELGRPPR